jgi:uncharacterized membrane protein YdjX (TVP38/TMEM64 family)
MTRPRILGTVAFIFIALLIGVYFATDSLRDLDSIRKLIAQISTYADDNRRMAQVAYFMTYLFVATFAIPVSIFLTLLGGALFGVVEGTLLSWIACAIGATFSFLIARYALGEYLIDRLQKQLRIAKRSWAEDGLFYLFTLRLIPGFPFILANFLMALLPVRAFSFFWVTLAGTLPLTVVYTNAGYRLGEIRSLQGILQPPLIISLIAVGVAPLILKKLLSVWNKRQRVTNA